MSERPPGDDGNPTPPEERQDPTLEQPAVAPEPPSTDYEQADYEQEREYIDTSTHRSPWVTAGIAIGLVALALLIGLFAGYLIGRTNDPVVDDPVVRTTSSLPLPSSSASTSTTSRRRVVRPATTVSTATPTTSQPSTTVAVISSTAPTTTLPIDSPTTGQPNPVN